MFKATLSIYLGGTTYNVIGGSPKEGSLVFGSFWKRPSLLKRLPLQDLSLAFLVGCGFGYTLLTRKMQFNNNPNIFA